MFKRYEQRLHNYFVALDIEVNVDGRHLVATFKEWLATLLGIDVGQFVIVKHYSESDEDGYETNNNDDDTIHDAFHTVTKVFKF